jgi:signal peptidase I
MAGAKFVADDGSIYRPILKKGDNKVYNDGEVYRWCKENTRAPFYTAPSWHGKRLVQFEDDSDAIMFALRFS